MNQNSRMTYFIFGFIFLAFAGLFLSASITAGVFPVGHDVILIGVSVMAFCNAYLYPQLKSNDERAKAIREKGMFYSYFMILMVLAIFMGLFQFTGLNLSGYQTVSVIATLMMIIVFSSFVVMSKRI